MEDAFHEIGEGGGQRKTSVREERERGRKPDKKKVKAR